MTAVMEGEHKKTNWKKSFLVSRFSIAEKCSSEIRLGIRHTVIGLCTEIENEKARKNEEELFAQRKREETRKSKNEFLSGEALMRIIFSGHQVRLTLDNFTFSSLNWREIHSLRHPRENAMNIYPTNFRFRFSPFISLFNRFSFSLFSVAIWTVLETFTFFRIPKININWIHHLMWRNQNLLFMIVQRRANKMKLKMFEHLQKKSFSFIKWSKKTLKRWMRGSNAKLCSKSSFWTIKLRTLKTKRRKHFV